MAICDLDVAPAFERSKHHEEIGGAIALVLVIETGRASRFHRNRHAHFGNELLRGFVEANQRTIAVAWPRVDGQHVFHSGYERAVGLRRDDPVLAAMGLKSVFLSARPIVLSLARSTMPSSTTLFSFHPSPASEISAFNKIRAFSTRRAGVFPFRIRVSSRSRSSPLSLTTYFFTEISFAAMIASLASRWRRKRITKSFQIG